MSELRPALVPLPPTVRSLVDRIAAAGGRALLVGGCVRDALLHQAIKDLDVEVHGLDADALRRVLRTFGAVNEVGRAFGVFKLRLGGEDLDVSLPRRDSKIGAGHKGIQAVADPALGIVEAARRRDLTINAIAWDPRTGELLDPFLGVEDLQRGLLRAVDDAHFVEDPLRALRVAQFVSRFGFSVAPELEALCCLVPLGELPAERVRGEVEKLLLRSAAPSMGWNFAWRAQLWARVLPAWNTACPGAIDRLAVTPLEGAPRRLAVLLAASAGGPGLTHTLDRLRIFTWEGYDVRTQALRLDQARALAPHDAAAALPTRARRLAESVDVELFAALTDDPPLAAAAETLGVLRSPLVPLLSGRDLLAIGIPHGPGIGKLLAEVREAQLTGHLSSPEEALAWARGRIR